MQFIEHRYGGRREMLRHLQAICAAAVGRYAGLRSIDWARVERLIFVCKGNICRSPYAAHLACSLGANAISCGIEATGGHPAYPAALRNAEPRGIDLAMHVSRPISQIEFGTRDLLLMFEPGHVDTLLQSPLSGSGAQFTLLGLWSRPCRPLIADPYGRSDAYFQNCFARIESSVQAVMDKLAEVRPARAPAST